MDAKQGYSDATSRMKLDIEAERGSGDVKRHEALMRGMARMKKRMKGWLDVDFNKIKADFAPNAEPEYGDIKIRYRGERFTLVTDVNGYARIQPNDLKGRSENISYVDINGINPFDVNPNITMDEYFRRTHFRIKQRREMK